MNVHIRYLLARYDGVELTHGVELAHTDGHSTWSDRRRLCQIPVLLSAIGCRIYTVVILIIRVPGPIQSVISGLHPRFRLINQHYLGVLARNATTGYPALLSLLTLTLILSSFQQHTPQRSPCRLAFPLAMSDNAASEGALFESIRSGDHLKISNLFNVEGWIAIGMF